MNRQCKILIADRNHHVRELIKRELSAEGYAIRMAEDSRQVLKWVFHPEAVDLLILDPNLPDADGSSLMAKLGEKSPELPVVLHVFFNDHSKDYSHINVAAVVEKKGNSVEQLKQVVLEIMSTK